MPARTSVLAFLFFLPAIAAVWSSRQARVHFVKERSTPRGVPRWEVRRTCAG